MFLFKHRSCSYIPERWYTSGYYTIYMNIHLCMHAYVQCGYTDIYVYMYGDD